MVYLSSYNHTYLYLAGISVSEELPDIYITNPLIFHYDQLESQASPNKGLRTPSLTMNFLAQFNSVFVICLCMYIFSPIIKVIMQFFQVLTWVSLFFNTHCAVKWKL